MPNPAGYSQTLRVPERADDTTDKLAKKPVSVLLSEGLDAAVRQLPNRTAWLRRVIREAAEREGLT